MQTRPLTSADSEPVPSRKTEKEIRDMMQRERNKMVLEKMNRLFKRPYKPLSPAPYEEYFRRQMDNIFEDTTCDSFAWERGRVAACVENFARLATADGLNARATLDIIITVCSENARYS